MKIDICDKLWEKGLHYAGIDFSVWAVKVCHSTRFCTYSESLNCYSFSQGISLPCFKMHLKAHNRISSFKWFNKLKIDPLTLFPEPVTYKEIKNCFFTGVANFASFFFLCWEMTVLIEQKFICLHWNTRPFLEHHHSGICHSFNKLHLTVFAENNTCCILKETD